MNLSTYIATQCDPSLQLGKAMKTTHHSRSNVFLCWLRPAEYDRLALNEGPQLLCTGDLYVASILYATFTNMHWLTGDLYIASILYATLTNMHWCTGLR